MIIRTSPAIKSAFFTNASCFDFSAITNLRNEVHLREPLRVNKTKRFDAAL